MCASHISTAPSWKLRCRSLERLSTLSRVGLPILTVRLGWVSRQRIILWKLPLRLWAAPWPVAWVCRWLRPLIPALCRTALKKSWMRLLSSFACRAWCLRRSLAALAALTLTISCWISAGNNTFYPRSRMVFTIGTILDRHYNAAHADHIHVEPKSKKTGTPPKTNPGMTAGVKAIYEALNAEFGPGRYFLDS